MLAAVNGQIRTEVDGAVGWLIVDRPDKRNALSLEMWQAIPTQLATLVGDPNVRVVVLRGEGTDAFVAGADISQFEQSRLGEGAEVYHQATTGAYDAVASCPKPTIAMIHGFCVGGGMALALSADLRYADTNGRFGIPAAKLGLGYEPSGVQRLMAIVGPSFALEVLYSAKLFDVATALRWGLVNEVAAPEDLGALVADMAGRISANAPLTHRATKTVMNTVLDGVPLSDAPAVDAALDACMDSSDYLEGIRAFMEKRTPEFRGQ